VIAAFAPTLAAADAAPLPTVPARPAWCAKRIDAALEARSPGTRYRLTALHRDGAYAYVNWREGEMGGQAVLVRDDAGWCVLGAGGGAMDEQILIGYGVPRATAHRLYAAMRKDMK
jgi:hypothetical protein